MKIYTVRDSKVEAYLPPFYAANDAVATRMIKDTADDPNSLFHKHPIDFTVVYIGEFYEQSGEIIPADHKIIGKIIDIMGPFNEIK